LKYGNLIKTGLILLILLSVTAVIIQLQKEPEYNSGIPEIETGHQYLETEAPLSQTEKEESREERSVTESREAERQYLETANYPEDESCAEDMVDPETYGPYGEVALGCYFTNTNIIDTENALPLYAHASMVEKTQKYLEEQELPAMELYCMDGSIVHNGTRTSFQVRCVDAGNQIITMTYDRDSKTWEFSKD